MTRRRWILVAALTIAGAIAGVAAIRLPASTNAEVRDAARSLVPPGLTVTSESSGYRGDFPPPKGPYQTHIETSGGGDVDARLELFRGQAGVAGWHVKGTKDFEGAVTLDLEPRRDLRGHVNVYKPNDLVADRSAIVVERPSAAARQFWWGFGGAVAGLSLALAYVWVARLRSQEHKRT